MFIKKNRRFYDRIKDINVLKQNLIYDCLIKLWNLNKQFKINIKIKTPDKKEEQQINNTDIEKITKDARKEQIKIEYSHIKQNGDDIDFEKSNETEIFNIQEFKIYNKDNNNLVYLCSNGDLSKDITDDILPGNMQIKSDNNAEQFNILCLITGDYLDKKSNPQRDNFCFDDRDKIIKKVKKLIKKGNFSELDKKVNYMFEDNMISKIKSNIHVAHQTIKTQIEKSKKEFADRMAEVGISKQTQQDELEKYDPTKSVKENLNRAAEKDGKALVLKRQEIIEKYRQLIAMDTQRGGGTREVKTIESKDNSKNTDRDKLARELTDLINQANKMN